MPALAHPLILSLFCWPGFSSTHLHQSIHACLARRRRDPQMIGPATEPLATTQSVGRSLQRSTRPTGRLADPIRVSPVLFSPFLSCPAEQDYGTFVHELADIGLRLSEREAAGDGERSSSLSHLSVSDRKDGWVRLGLPPRGTGALVAGRSAMRKTDSGDYSCIMSDPAPLHGLPLKELTWTGRRDRRGHGFRGRRVPGEIWRGIAMSSSRPRRNEAASER